YNLNLAVMIQNISQINPLPKHTNTQTHPHTHPHPHPHTPTHTPTLPTSCYQDKKGSGGMGANRKKQLDLHTLQNTSFPVSSIHPTRNTTSPRPSLCQRSRMFHHHS